MNDTQEVQATEPETKKRRQWFTEAVALVTVSGLGYFFAFRFQEGYASYFGIPREMVTIDLSSVLVVISIVLIAIPASFYMIFMTLPWTERIKNLPFRVKKDFVITVVAVMFLVSFYPRHVITWLVFSIILAFILFFDFILPLLQKEHKGVPYLGRIQANDAAEYTGSLQQALDNKYGTVLIWLFVAFITGSGMSSMAGKGWAQRERVFPVVKSSCPEQVIVAVYGDRLFIAPLDRQQKQVGRDITIRRITDDSPLTFKSEAVGPLESVSKNIAAQAFCDWT